MPTELVYAVVHITCDESRDAHFVVAGCDTLSRCREFIQFQCNQRMATDSYSAGRDQFLQALDMYSTRLSDGLGWDAMTYNALGWPVDFSWQEGPEPEDPAELPEIQAIFAIMATPAYPSRP